MFCKVIIPMDGSKLPEQALTVRTLQAGSMGWLP
jgi:hypothetical protein